MITKEQWGYSVQSNKFTTQKYPHYRNQSLEVLTSNDNPVTTFIDTKKVDLFARWSEDLMLLALNLSRRRKIKSVEKLNYLCKTRNSLTKRELERILTDEQHSCRKYLPVEHNKRYNLRRTRKYAAPNSRTERHNGSFIPRSTRLFNM